MFAVDLARWWYAKGWSIFSGDVKNKLKDTADTFSIGELLQTLFKPYRQIASNADGNQSKINAFFDQLISRLVGALSRLALIVTGLILMLVEAVIGGAIIVLWPTIPFLPIIGIILAIVGVKL